MVSIFARKFHRLLNLRHLYPSAMVPSVNGDSLMRPVVRSPAHRLKSFPSPKAINTTGPQLPKYISHAFGSLDKPWKPGYLRSAYGAICCHLFKPNASLSVGQSYKDFYIRKP
jgi:hypothetical protein